jgi:peptide/nickel transport system substrate-binding protein
VKKAWLIGLTLMLAGSLILGGCSGNKTSADQAKDTINISLNADPPKLDPAYSSALVDRMVFQSIFDKLVDLDKNGKIVPMLAEKWEISSDKKTFIFHLRKGAKFHDGTDFNADAVKFNFERNMQPDSVRRNELKLVDHVTAVDPYTVKVQLKQPFAPFLAVLTDRAGMMVSPAAAQKEGKNFMNHPVGTGPFIYKSRIKGSTIVLEKNPNYWRKGLPKLNRVVYKVITDPNVALMNLRSGEVDITNKFPPKEIGRIINDPKVIVVNHESQGYQGFHLNTSKPPFNNKELRQAVDLLINRDAIAKVVFGAAGSPAYSPFAPSTFAYNPHDKPETPSVKKAKELLNKAGKKNGFTFTLKIPTTPAGQQVGQMIQNMLRPAGIHVQLEKVEFGTLLEQAETGNMQAVALGWSGRPDPDLNTYDFLATVGSQNYSRYSNPEVDKLLNSARQEMDQTKRKAMYDQVMNIVHEDVPYVYLYNEHDVFGLSKDVQGFQYIPDGLIRTVELSKK